MMYTWDEYSSSKCRLATSFQKSMLKLSDLGLEYRVIRISDQLIPIVGIVDLCVTLEHRGDGVAKALLKHAQARSQGQMFILAMADDHRIYEKMGFETLKAAKTTWFAIDNVKSHSIIERDLSDILLIKPLREKPWPDGKIDLLGHLF